MRIAVLGATGQLGSRIVSQALEAGHQVLAPVRRPDAIPSQPGLSVTHTALSDTAGTAAAISGAEVLISAIGGGMKATSFMQDHLPLILRAADQAQVNRLVLVSVFGAGDTADLAALPARMVYHTVLRGFLTDRARSERLLPDSELDWTIAYPVNLTRKPARNQVGVHALADVAKVPGMPALPLDDAAGAVLDLALNPRPCGSRMLITTSDGWLSR